MHVAIPCVVGWTSTASSPTLNNAQAHEWKNAEAFRPLAAVQDEVATQQHMVRELVAFEVLSLPSLTREKRCGGLTGQLTHVHL